LHSSSSSRKPMDSTIARSLRVIFIAPPHCHP
jgi:hypothetical protein